MPPGIRHDVRSTSTLKKLDAQEDGLLKLASLAHEADQSGRDIKRIVVACEAGRDGLWLAC